MFTKIRSTYSTFFSVFIFLISVSFSQSMLTSCAKKSDDAPITPSSSTDNNANNAFSIATTSTTIAPNGSYTITPNGGMTPYTFSLSSSFGSLSTASGTASVYSAPSSTGSVTVNVKDAAGVTGSVVITISSSGSGGGGTSKLDITPKDVSVQPNATVSFTTSGGIAPYTYSVVSGGGSFNSSTYTAPSSNGTVDVRVTDVTGATAMTTVVVGSSSSSVSISPQNANLSTGATLSFSAAGGTAPYTYSVISGGGSFSGNMYTAPSTAGTIDVKVTDANGKTAETYIYVSTSGTSGITCDGTFSVTYTGGYSATLTLVQNNSGIVAGTLVSDSGGTTYYDPINGSCVNGNINFTNQATNTTYTGTYSTNTSGKVTMSGTAKNSKDQSTGWNATKN